MDRKERSRAKRILKRNMIAGLILLMFISLSVAGVTYSWFIDSSVVIHNTFTAGTVEVSVTDPIYPGSVEGVSNPELTAGESIELTYSITQTGTKSNYIRASFDGYWRKSYHRNVASVRAFYNDLEITDSNSAYYSYGDHDFTGFVEPVVEQAQYGFSYNVPKSPLQSDPLPETYTTPTNGSESGDTGNDGPGDSSSSLMDYLNSCNGHPLVTPVLAQDNPTYFPDNNTKRDPAPDKLPKPGDCSTYKYFKINLDQNDIGPAGEILTYKIGDTDTETNDAGGFFEVDILKKMNSDGKIVFAFVSKYHPVYVAYAKGQNQGGNLYMYILDPAYEDGVMSDCGLMQPGGGWSHITLFYCEPEEDPEPGIQLQKQVSVEKDSNDDPIWEDADSAPGPVVSSEMPPIFRFIVTNTGNVPLTNIDVHDEYLDVTYTIGSLNPGQAVTTDTVTDTNWKTNQTLSTDNVTVEVITSDWTPSVQQLGITNYFYYLNKIDINHPSSFDVIFKVSIAEDDEGEYDGAILTLYAFFEAIQASNNMPGLNNWDDVLFNQ